MIRRCWKDGTMTYSFSSLLHVLMWLSTRNLCIELTLYLGFYNLLQEPVKILFIVNKLNLKHQTMILSWSTLNQDIYVFKL